MKAPSPDLSSFDIPLLFIDPKGNHTKDYPLWDIPGPHGPSRRDLLQLLLLQEHEKATKKTLQLTEQDCHRKLEELQQLVYDVYDAESMFGTLSELSGQSQQFKDEVKPVIFCIKHTVKEPLSSAGVSHWLQLRDKINIFLDELKLEVEKQCVPELIEQLKVVYQIDAAAPSPKLKIGYVQTSLARNVTLLSGQRKCIREVTYSDVLQVPGCAHSVY